MNKELQRIKIAEACGWKRCSYPPTYRQGGHEHAHAMFGLNTSPLLGMHRPEWKGKKDHGPFSTPVPPPDYLNDLNACAEFEKVLTEEQHYQYARTLEEVVATVGRCRPHLASAPQRCDAFLKVMNLWTPTGEENE